MRKYDICKFVDAEDSEDYAVDTGFYPVRKSINQWLADYYGIDLNKVERERKVLLEWLREKQ